MQLRMILSIQRPLLLPFISQGVSPLLLVITISYSFKNSSQLYQKFDLVVLLSHGRALYSGPGGFAPAEYFSNAGSVASYQKGYNVAEYLLEVANDPPVSLFQLRQSHSGSVESNDGGITSEKGPPLSLIARGDTSEHRYATTFLTQLQHLCGREWKTLKRDKSLFVTHVAVASILGVFCGQYTPQLPSCLLNLKQLISDRWSLFPYGHQYRRISVTNWMLIFPRKHLDLCESFRL